MENRTQANDLDIDETFIVCDCYSHGLWIERFKEDESVFINLFERGTTGKKLSFTEKLKWCWQILIHGHPWTDMIILDKDKQKALVEFLSKK